MAEGRFERVRRRGHLQPDQIAWDEEVRRKIREEFPPAPRRPIPDSLSGALKKAIRESGMTLYEIAKKARVSRIILSRFLSGERDIRMETADKLGDALGLRLVERI